MDFAISRADQFFCWEQDTMATMYKNLHYDAQKTNWIRITGLGVSVASVFISIAARICGIVELAFKAVINIIGAPFFDNCYFCRGLKLLSIGVIVNALLILGLPLYIAVDIVVTTPGMAIDPVAYSNCRNRDHIRSRGLLIGALS